MVMVDTSLVLDIMIAFSIAAGAAFAIVELRALKKDRRIGLVLQASLHWTTKEFEDVYCRLWRADANDIKELEKQISYADLCRIVDFQNAVARLATEGLVEASALTGYFPFSYTWNKLKDWIDAERAAANLPRMWVDLENIARLQEEEGGPLVVGRASSG